MSLRRLFSPKFPLRNIQGLHLTVAAGGTATVPKRTPANRFCLLNIYHLSTSARATDVSNDVSVFVRRLNVQKSCTPEQLQFLSSRVNHESATIETLIDACNCVQYLTSRDEGVILRHMSHCVAQIDAIIKRDKLPFKAAHIASLAIGIKDLKTDSDDLFRIIAFMNHQIIRCAQAYFFLKEKNVCKILYGLKGRRADTPEVRELLGTLIRTSFGCKREPVDTHFLAMAVSGMQAMTAESAEVRAVLSYLTPRIASSPADLTGKQMRMILYGLRKMQGNVPEVRLLLSVLAQRNGESKLRWRADDVGMAVDGLQGLGCAEAEVLAVIRSVASKVRLSEGTYNANIVARIVDGLKSMNSDSSEVRFLLKELVPKIENSVGELDGDGVSMCVFGLRHMSSDVEEVSDFISALLPKIKDYRGPLRVKAAVWAYYALHMKTSSSPVVLDLIGEINRLVAGSELELFGKETSMVLYGMHGMQADSKEVRKSLSIISSKIAPDCSLTGRQVAMALFGLQKMRSDVPEVVALLVRLLPLISACRDVLDSQQVGMMLHGFSAMDSSSPEVRAALSVLSGLIESSKVALETEALNSALQGLRGMDTELPEVKSIFQALSTSSSELQNMLQQ